jgi:BMFP domain-containing protein YqiC
MTNPKAKIIEDVTRILSGASGTAQAMRQEVEQVISAKFDQMLSEKGLVLREEFEVVRDMAEKARDEVESLREEIKSLKK